MEGLGKALIVGALGYLGYQWYAGKAVAAPPSNSAPILPVQTTTAKAPATVVQNNTLLNVIQTLNAASLVNVAGVPSNQVYSFYQWNYVLNTMISGYMVPAPEDLGINGATNMDASTYYGIILNWAKKQAGVSGLRGTGVRGIYVYGH